MAWGYKFITKNLLEDENGVINDDRYEFRIAIDPKWLEEEEHFELVQGIVNQQFTGGAGEGNFKDPNKPVTRAKLHHFTQGSGSTEYHQTNIKRLETYDFADRNQYGKELCIYVNPYCTNTAENTKNMKTFMLNLWSDLATAGVPLTVAIPPGDRPILMDGKPTPFTYTFKTEGEWENPHGILWKDIELNPDTTNPQHVLHHLAFSSADIALEEDSTVFDCQKQFADLCAMHEHALSLFSDDIDALLCSDEIGFSSINLEDIVNALNEVIATAQSIIKEAEADSSIRNYEQLESLAKKYGVTLDEEVQEQYFNLLKDENVADFQKQRKSLFIRLKLPVIQRIESKMKEKLEPLIAQIQANTLLQTFYQKAPRQLHEGRFYEVLLENKIERLLSPNIKIVIAGLKTINLEQELQNYALAALAPGLSKLSYVSELPKISDQLEKDFVALVDVLEGDLKKQCQKIINNFKVLFNKDPFQIQQAYFRLVLIHQQDLGIQRIKKNYSPTPLNQTIKGIEHYLRYRKNTINPLSYFFDYTRGEIRAKTFKTLLYQAGQIEDPHLANLLIYCLLASKDGTGLKRAVYTSLGFQTVEEALAVYGAKLRGIVNLDKEKINQMNTQVIQPIVEATNNHGQANHPEIVDAINLFNQISTQDVKASTASNS